MTMSLVSTVTVGAGGAASIQFTGISGSATDLLLVLSTRTATSSAYGDQLKIAFNNDTTTSNYTWRALIGDSSGPFSASDSTTLVLAGYTSTNGLTANTFGNASIYIPNYSGSTSKSVTTDSVNENNASSSVNPAIGASRWTGTAAITSVTISSANGNNFVQYSTASLYTITKGSGGATVS